jgi:hypothetical protein
MKICFKRIRGAVAIIYSCSFSYVLMSTAIVFISNNAFARSFYVDIADEETVTHSCTDTNDIQIHYDNSGNNEPEYSSTLIIDSVTVDPIPEWKVNYGITINGEIGNTTVGIRITVTNLNGHAELRFSPMVEVRIDRNMLRSYQMSLAAHEGEYEHYVDVYLCWKNVFTPFVANFVGKTQDIQELKQVVITHFNERMNQTRDFWDESGRHDVNYFGFKNEVLQTEVDAYRLEAYGETYPYSYNSGVLVDVEDEPIRFRSKS